MKLNSTFMNQIDGIEAVDAEARATIEKCLGATAREILDEGVVDLNFNKLNYTQARTVFLMLERKRVELGPYIGNFTYEDGFLSNFHSCTVIYNQLKFLNAEAAYQSAKTEDPDVRKRFVEYSASQAKRAGRKVLLRADWEDVKEAVMLEVIRIKFRTNPDLADKLIATEFYELIEGNTWGDYYWGVCKGRGKNKLGRILESVRRELRLERWLDGNLKITERA